MWQIINVEPAYGVCSICRSHECGLVDGKHQWIHTEALDDSRENIVIGYNCVKLFAENLGITKHLVDKIVLQEPTDEQLLRVLKESLNKPGVVTLPYDDIPSSIHTDSMLGVRDPHIEEVQSTPEPKTGVRKRTR